MSLRRRLTSAALSGVRPDDLAAMKMDYVDWGRLDMPAALDALIEAQR